MSHSNRKPRGICPYCSKEVVLNTAMQCVRHKRVTASFPAGIECIGTYSKPRDVRLPR